jgi:hypothetical protein
VCLLLQLLLLLQAQLAFAVQVPERTAVAASLH